MRVPFSDYGFWGYDIKGKLEICALMVTINIFLFVAEFCRGVTIGKPSRNRYRSIQRRFEQGRRCKLWYRNQGLMNCTKSKQLPLD